MKTIKHSYLYDNEGKPMTNKIRRDKDGLYVIRHGMRGVLKKTVKTMVIGNFYVIDIIRKVDYYI